MSFSGYTREDLLEELIRLEEEIGRTPTKDEVQQLGKYPLQLYHSEFDSLKDAVKTADLVPVGQLTAMSGVNRALWEAPKDAFPTEISSLYELLDHWVCVECGRTLLSKPEQCGECGCTDFRFVSGGEQE